MSARLESGHRPDEITWPDPCCSNSQRDWSGHRGEDSQDIFDSSLMWPRRHSGRSCPFFYSTCVCFKSNFHLSEPLHPLLLHLVASLSYYTTWPHPTVELGEERDTSEDRKIAWVSLFDLDLLWSYSYHEVEWQTSEAASRWVHYLLLYCLATIMASRSDVESGEAESEKVSQFSDGKTRCFIALDLWKPAQVFHGISKKPRSEFLQICSSKFQ